MFDVEKIVSKTPFFESFCSVDKIYSLIQELEGDDRFRRRRELDGAVNIAAIATIQVLVMVLSRSE